GHDITLGSGNDNYTGSYSRDTIDGGDGNDTVYASYGDDSVQGGIGNDYLLGQEGRDTLNGGTGANTIYGGPGNDAITGGAGSDQFNNVGYSGSNLFTGGGASHHDTYVLNWHPGNGSYTEITDFTAGSSGDHIDINEVLNNVLTGYHSGDNPFTTGYMQL